MKKYKLALHIFRRDLRLDDNTALRYALANTEKVITCFIFDPRQVINNPFQSDNALQFMIGSLEDLNDQLKRKGSKLYLFDGPPDKVITDLLSSFKISLVTINQDYTPFAQQRDDKISSICKKQNVDYVCLPDALIQEPESIYKADGKPYTVFTPFLNKARIIPVRLPQKNTFNNYYSGIIKQDRGIELYTKILPQKNPAIFLRGGRKEGLKLLKSISALTDYHNVRNYPARSHTSHLSAHNKFGTVSIREVYHQIEMCFGSSHTLISELYWRDFFTHIVYHFPYVFGHSFRKKFNDIKWDNNIQLFKAWCKGKTGFPIVDAGMRELNTTGYMHNRVRMITASFLVKDLHIDWRWGEKYFARQLIDYDPAVNNGNWQWAASTGCDAQPYFRIFNPWRQQERFDLECKYIKKWIPELKKISSKEIHNLYKQKHLKVSSYPGPMVDHSIEAHHTKIIYASIAKTNP